MQTTRFNNSTTIIFALLLLGSFFIPWVKWESYNIPGYALPSGNFFSLSAKHFNLDNPYPNLGILLKIFWLLPAAALAALMFAVVKKNSAFASLLAGVIALTMATVYILFTRTLLMLGVGNSLLNSLCPGIYLAILGGMGIILASVRTKLWIRLFLIIIGPLLAWMGFLIIEKQIETEKYEDTANIESKYTVWGQDLIREFRENDSLANAKYREQILTVNGRISETEMPNDSTINIRIADSTGSFAIFPFVDQYFEKARKLSAGDSVVIRASCSGGIYSEILEMETISFKRCALIN
jgi:hypothetical protein